MHKYINATYLVHFVLHTHTRRHARARELMADQLVLDNQLGAHLWGRLFSPLSALLNCLEFLVSGWGPVRPPFCVSVSIGGVCACAGLV